MKLAGQRIVILGGSSGIGLATAQAAALEGAAVVIASSRERRVEEAVAALPAGAEGQALDLTDEPAVKAFFAELGSFDHLAFTAGETLQLGPLPEIDIAAARDFFALRYWGAFMAAKYGSGHIRPGGSIVFTSGLASLRPHAGWSLGASKDATRRVVRCSHWPFIRLQPPLSQPAWPTTDSAFAKLPEFFPRRA